MSLAHTLEIALEMVHAVPAFTEVLDAVHFVRTGFDRECLPSTNCQLTLPFFEDLPERFQFGRRHPLITKGLSGNN